MLIVYVVVALSPFLFCRSVREFCVLFFSLLLYLAPRYTHTSNDDATQSSCVREATATMNAFQSLGLMNFSLNFFFSAMMFSFIFLIGPEG